MINQRGGCVDASIVRKHSYLRYTQQSFLAVSFGSAGTPAGAEFTVVTSSHQRNGDRAILPQEIQDLFFWSHSRKIMTERQPANRLRFGPGECRVCVCVIGEIRNESHGVYCPVVLAKQAPLLQKAPIVVPGPLTMLLT